ncbi:PAS domain S-box protein [Marinomonas ostreistagni]|uniref:PAS domain S-box protein n=1 Tax=Marinomonas ostreistagni TaxID=359209 RepID=UPI00194FD43D|nr:PAS domain S-box protein [Marinomonas ostreistagni]MBM6550100.1 PAS domain S-box protein [Marinomonas ostreistagni]
MMDFSGKPLQWFKTLTGPFANLSPMIEVMALDYAPRWWVVLPSGAALYINQGHAEAPSNSEAQAALAELDWQPLGLNKGWFACPDAPQLQQNALQQLLTSLLTAQDTSCNVETASALCITQALKRLHAITATSTLNLHEKIDQILILGSEMLSLPFGIVSRVKHDNYRVAYCCSPNGELSVGAEFDLGDCYCVHTLNRDQVTGFYHAGQSEIALHPCYQTFQLEAYLGVSIRVQGEVWGTLNFSSPTPRAVDFSEDEYELVKLFGQWIGEELTRDRNAFSLRQAEQQHRLILESVHDGVIGLDADCKITFANVSAVAMTGYGLNELVGMPICRLINHANASKEHSCAITHAVRSGHKVSGVNDEFFDRHGRTFPVNFACTPITNELDNTLVTVLTFQDITEQIQAQVALKKQIKMFRSLFEDAPEGIVVVDRDRNITMVNPYVTAMFGYQEQDLLGKTAQFLYADAQAFEEVGLAYEDAGSPDYHEYRMVYRRADGSTFVAENVRSKVVDEEGHFNGFIVHCRDITARLNIEEDIEKARNRLSIATQSAGIGIWEMGIENDTLLWDDLMHSIYGVSYGQVTRREHWDELIHPDDLRRVQASAEKAIATQSDLDVDFRIIRPDGDLRHIKANARVAVNSEGQPAYLFGVNFDITERYQTETILKNAREEAVRASQAKSNFLATMSHEIRTPLNGVLGMAEILSGSQLTERQHSQLDIIRNSGESLLELINEILDFSKIEAGHLSLELMDFDLEQLVFDLSRLLVVKAESKGIDLLVQYNVPESMMLHGDAYRIRQVLMNLVGNAIKFTQSGHVIIKVEAKPSQKSQQQSLIISVEDTGIGIDEAVQGQLFQAFTQADNSTTRKFGGTGLGLAITKQLVELMGGEIWVKSELGKGSTFGFSLQLAQSASPVRSCQEVEHFNFQRILVVDDNSTNLSIIESQLEQLGLMAEYEHNAILAVDRVIAAAQDPETDSFDLLVLDYLMPELDGLSLNKVLIDALPNTECPKTLMLSSAGILSPEQLKEAGVKVCVNKPSSINELRAGLIEVLRPEVSAVMVTRQDGRIQRQEAYEHDLTDATILVVEDMKANIAVVKGMLAQLGCRVEVAENGLEGVQQWRALEPDLILMDLHMPVMDGLTAIQEIRSLEGPGQPAVPILALTADIQPERIAQVESIGGNGYISKPFKRQELLDTIVQWLGCSQAVSANDATSLQGEGAVLQNIDSIDPRVLDDLEELLGDQVKEIAHAFVQDANAVFLEFDQALAAPQDSSLFYRPAHSLKSVSANVGAMVLSAMATELERQAKADSVVDPNEQIVAMKQEFATVKQVLQHTGRLD